MAGNVFRALLYVGAVVVLVGCDGSIGFHDAAGALQRTSGKKIVRGAADRMQTDREDPERTKARRDFAESAAQRQDLDLSSDLGDILKENGSYRNVVFNNLAKGMGELPVYPIQVEFDIEGGFHVELGFLVQEKTSLGILHMTKLPIFDSGSVKHGEARLPIRSDQVLALVLSKDRNAFKAHVDKLWGAMRERQQAEAEAITQRATATKPVACEQQAQERAARFQQSAAALGDAEKQAATEQFEATQAATTTQCLMH